MGLMAFTSNNNLWSHASCRAATGEEQQLPDEWMALLPGSRICMIKHVHHGTGAPHMCDTCTMMHCCCAGLTAV